MNILTLLILWTIQQTAFTWYATKVAVDWAWLCLETEVYRFTRVVQEARKSQSRIDDGIWAAQRVYALSCLFSVVVICWSVTGAIGLHSLWWAVPTVVLVTGFWSYIRADTRGVADRLRERKMWITGQKWEEAAGQE